MAVWVPVLVKKCTCATAPCYSTYTAVVITSTKFSNNYYSCTLVQRVSSRILDTTAVVLNLVGISLSGYVPVPELIHIVSAIRRILNLNLSTSTGTW
eukprot:SAG31_NODE_82_length_27046_cov_45.857275_27_plen_97_part_00